MDFVRYLPLYEKLCTISDSYIYNADALVTKKLIQSIWIWRENQRGAPIGFSYSEIRFLKKI